METNSLPERSWEEDPPVAAKPQHQTWTEAVWHQRKAIGSKFKTKPEMPAGYDRQVAGEPKLKRQATVAADPTELANRDHTRATPGVLQEGEPKAALRLEPDQPAHTGCDGPTEQRLCTEQDPQQGVPEGPRAGGRKDAEHPQTRTVTTPGSMGAQHSTTTFPQAGGARVTSTVISDVVLCRVICWLKGRKEVPDPQQD
jgi:hypothetical protein